MRNKLHNKLENKISKHPYKTLLDFLFVPGSLIRMSNDLGEVLPKLERTMYYSLVSVTEISRIAIYSYGIYNLIN